MEPKFLIGIPEMDAQHARLFALVDRARTPGLDESDIHLLVLELVNYAREHLEKEEEFLKRKGLDDFLVEHAKLHKEFRERAIDLYNQLREAEDSEVRQRILTNIIEFCESWLQVHINVEDREYARLLTQK